MFIKNNYNLKSLIIFMLYKYNFNSVRLDLDVSCVKPNILNCIF